MTTTNGIKHGEGCVLDFNYNIYDRIEVGDGTKIKKSQLIRRHPQFDGKIKIGRNVSIERASIDFTCDVQIEDDVWILEDALILTHWHTKKTDEDIGGSSLYIYRNATIHARAIILPQVEYIGQDSIIGAGAVVTKNVPEGVMVAGNPAVIKKKIF